MLSNVSPERTHMPDTPTGAVSAGTPRFERDPEPAHGTVVDDRGISQLVKDLGEQTATLVRKEMELAKAEITQQGKKAGKGAGLFGAAGLFGVFAFAALTTFFIAGLAAILDSTWLAALIVAVVYGAIAGVLALSGKKKVQDVSGPEKTQASVKQDIESAKAHARAGKA